MTGRRPAYDATSRSPPAALRHGQALTELASESVVAFTATGEIVYWNSCAAALYGWSRHDALGRNLATLLSPPGSAPPARAYESVAADGRWVGHLMRTTSDGREIEVSVRWTSRSGSSGTIVEFGPAEIRAPELDRLQASEARYRQMFQRAPVALMLDDAETLGDLVNGLKARGVVDLDAYIDAHPEFLDQAIDIVALAEVNQQAVALFVAGSETELLGPVRHLWRDSPGTFRRALVALYGGASYFSEETRVRILDGRTVDVLFSLAFAQEGSGATLNGMRDITARRQAEANLRRTTADFTHAARLSTLGELTSSLSHEVKQPLAAILTDAQTSLRWLARDPPNVEKAHDLAARIVASVEHASAIIERIRDMAGKRETPHASLDLNSVVRECLKFMRHECEENAITILAAFRLDLPPITGDRIQLQQVVVNLIVNGLQALRTRDIDGRSISVATDLDERGEVVFTLRDSGPGIPEEQLPQIFESFFTTKSDGLGIGLASCRSIVQAHGGQISMSNHSDGGAEFRISMPAANREVSAVRPGSLAA